MINQQKTICNDCKIQNATPELNSNYNQIDDWSNCFQTKCNHDFGSVGSTTFQPQFNYNSGLTTLEPPFNNNFNTPIFPFTKKCIYCGMMDVQQPTTNFSKKCEQCGKIINPTSSTSTINLPKFL